MDAERGSQLHALSQRIEFGVLRLREHDGDEYLQYARQAHDLNSQPLIHSLLRILVCGSTVNYAGF